MSERDEERPGEVNGDQTPAEARPAKPAGAQSPAAGGTGEATPPASPGESRLAASAGSQDEAPAAEAGDTPAADTPETHANAPVPEPADAVAHAPGPEAERPAATPPPPRRGWFAEPPETALDVDARQLAARSRRSFLAFGLGALATAVGAWWLLPEDTKARLLPQAAHDRLDTLAGRVGLSRRSRDRALNRGLTFDDDVAEALYSKDRLVRTYDRSAAGPLRNNYDGQTPDPDYIPGWRLSVSGLASGRRESLSIDDLARSFPMHEQVTRIVCVEGWSAVAWWNGIRFADFLEAFPPQPGARWAALRSSVNLDDEGDSDPYYVSIDLETARHPQALLATHLGGMPLTVEHGAPLRLVAPMKLGLKNIKAITDLEYTVAEPRDYWSERGYSKYDGL